MPSEAGGAPPAPGPPAGPAPALAGRLHPSTVLVSLFDQLRWLLWPAVGILVFGGGSGLSTLLVPLLVVGGLRFLLQGVVRYLMLTYRLEGGEMIIRDGIFERTERHIPFERIQDLQVEQGVVHRALGVANVRVQTAGGGGEPEASLSVLSLAEVERLRSAIATEAAPRRAARAGDEAPAGEVIRRLGVGEIALAGVTSRVVGPLLVFLGSVWGFADDVLPGRLYDDLGALVYERGRQITEGGARLAIALAIATLAVTFVAGLIASAVWHVALFYGFTLSRSGESLERRYGLLTRRSLSLPRRRIQVLEIEQSFLRRLTGLAAVRADAASDAGNREEKGGRDVLLPIVRAGEAEGLLPAFFPDFDPAPAEWRRVSRRAVRRATAKGALACLAAAVPALFWQGFPAGLWPLALVPAAYGASLLSYRNLGYALGDRFLRTRRGWLGRSVHVVPIRNIQAVAVRQSPFDRRHGLASLAVDTAGQAFTGGGPAIPSLPLEEARALARTLAHRAARAR